jgi:lipoyl-dependent peroxiredoxin
MISPVKTLVTTTATAIGGRNGHSETTDKLVSVDLSVPKAAGGPGKPNTVTPEHLFAAGYAACFGGAVEFVAKSHKKDATKAKTTCSVGFGPREGGGVGLVVDLKIEDASLPQAELEAFVREAHEKICAYSHATRDNVAVSFTVVGA